MKYYSYLSCLAFSAIFCSCHSKSEQLNTCEDAIDLNQITESAPNYISGIVNGKSFYYGDMDSRFTVYNAVSNTIYNGEGLPITAYTFGIVDTSFLQLWGTVQEKRPNFSFLFAINSREALKPYEVYDKYLVPGELLVANGKTSTAIPSIGITMNVSCDGETTTIRRSSVGDQPESYFRIKTVERTDLDTTVSYKVQVEFSMQLYTDIYGKQPWQRFSDGAAQLEFTVTK